jgi:hypothetical protein
MLRKLMPHLWRLNNWIDKKVLHITAWLRAVTDEPDRPYEDDVIEMLWKARCGK